MAEFRESNKIAQEKNEIEKEKQIKESFAVLSNYADESHGLGRAEALEFLNTELNTEKECNEQNQDSSEINEDNNQIDDNKKNSSENTIRSQQNKCIERHRLDGVNLENAVLIEINLDNGFLNYANFKNAKLDGSSFNKAQLKWSNFQGARIENSKFKGAKLYKANFSFLPIECEKPEEKDCKERTRLINADFSSEGENNTNLELAEFQDALLNNANFKDSNLKGVHFEWANLTGADLTGADLTGAELPNTTLQGVKGITKEQVMKANNWDSAIYDDEFRKNNLCEDTKDNDKVKFEALITVKGDGILDEYINNKDLQCFSFNELESEFLQRKDLTGVNFSNSNLTKANLQDAILKDVIWTGTNVDCTDFRNTDLTRETLENIDKGITDRNQRIENISSAIFDDNDAAKCQN